MSDTKKFPFKSYSALPNSLILNSVFNTADVYRVFVLSLTADKTTGETDTTISQLADFIGESVTNYQNKPTFTDRLRSTNDVSVVTVCYKGKSGQSGPKNRNRYSFRKPEKEDIFRMIHKEFVGVDIGIKLKGYLIKLFAVSHSETLFCDYSLSQLAKELHMSTGTISSYNKKLFELGLLVKLDNGILITCNGLKPVTVKTKMTKNILDEFEAALAHSISVYNSSHTDKINISSLSESDIKKMNLDKSLNTFAFYYKDGFRNVRNLNSLALYIASGGASLKSNTSINDSIIIL